MIALKIVKEAKKRQVNCKIFKEICDFSRYGSRAWFESYVQSMGKKVPFWAETV